MARKKSSKSKTPKQHSRYNRIVKRDILNPIARPLLSRQNPVFQNFDNRFFYPTKTTLPRAPITRYGAQTSLQTRVKKGRSLHETFQIIAPKKTLVCIRRKTRREVLFAAGLGGKKLNYRKVRRNAYSSMHC